MARASVKRAKWLRNGWLEVAYRTPTGVVVRRIGPGDKVTIPEAARALGTYRMRLDRLIRRGELQASGGGVAMVSWRELLRLKREWAARSRRDALSRNTRRDSGR